MYPDSTHLAGSITSGYVGRRECTDYRERTLARTLSGRPAERDGGAPTVDSLGVLYSDALGSAEGADWVSEGYPRRMDSDGNEGEYEMSVMGMPRWLFVILFAVLFSWLSVWLVDLNLVVFGVVVAAVLVLLLFLLLGRLADVELLRSLISVVGLLASIMLVRYWSLSWWLGLIVFALVGGVVWLLEDRLPKLVWGRHSAGS